MSINAISCRSSGNCSAVGSYVDSSGHTQGLLLTEAGGTWAAGVEAALPANASATNPSVFLNSVSCSSPGNCAAVGGYQDDTPSYDNSQVLLMTETGGVWATGVEGTLPADALPETQGNQWTDLVSVSCASPGNCTAVGTYLLNDHVHSPAGALFTESGGHWGAGVEAPLPANASASGASSADSVSCSSAGNCIAVGAYVDNANAGQGLLLTETAGGWSTGVEPNLPANAGTNPEAVLDAVSCASAGNCSAAGGYVDSSGRQQLLLISDTAGSWATGVEGNLPASSDSDGNIRSISCGSAGNCAAVGTYRDSSDNERALLLTQTAGTWATGVQAALPANAATTQQATLTSVSCATAGNCSAVGSYNLSSGGGGGLLLTETAGSWATGTEVAQPANGASAAAPLAINSISCPLAANCSGGGSYGVTSPGGGNQGLLLSTTTTPPEETLIISQTGPGSGTITSSPPGIDCGSSCQSSFEIGSEITLTASPRQDSTFDGWTQGACQGAGVGPCQVSISGPRTASASFALKTFLLTVQKSGSGSGGVSSSPAAIDCGSRCATSFDAGERVTLTATPGARSTFTGWSGGGCAGTGHCQVTVTADTTITATFATKPSVPTQCIVPKLKGKTLTAAKKAINKAHCGVGKITKVRSVPKKKGRVISERPKPGKHLAKGSKIALKVGK